MRIQLLRLSVLPLSTAAMLGSCSGPAAEQSVTAALSPPTGSIFPKGQAVPAANFTGTAYLYPLVKQDSVFNCVSGSVYFEPGARSNWHSHPNGQILFITEGLGYYQEKGQPIRLLHRGEVVQAQPGVEHWHGASPRQAMTHIALSVNAGKNTAVRWGRPVTDQEYNAYQK